MAEVERKAEREEGSPLWAGPGESLVVPGYRPDHEAVDPLADYPDYRGTISRHPKRPLVPIPAGLTEVTGPLLGEDRIGCSRALRSSRSGCGKTSTRPAAW